MSSKLADIVFYVVVGLLMLGIAILLIGAIESENRQDECNAKGGVYVKQPSGYICIEARRVE